MRRSGTTDINGDRVGYMAPEEFKEALYLHLGGWGWQTRFSRATGINQSTVSRYMRGPDKGIPIPKHVALMVQMIVELREANLPLPQAFNEEEYSVPEIQTDAGRPSQGGMA